MADANSTATTSEELAEQFPCTARPFAVWYNSSEGADHRKWAVNGEDGAACEDFEDMGTALKAAAEMSSEWDAEARIQAQALAEVTGADKPGIIRHIEEYCISMDVFFDLALNEIDKHNSDDFDGLRFLTEAAKAKLLDFDKKAHALQPAAELRHE